MTSLNFTHRTSTAALHAIFMAPGAPLANWVVPAAHISAPLQVALTNAHILSMSSGKVSQTDIDALVTALRHEAKFQDLLAASGTSTKTGSAAFSHPSIRSAHGHVTGCSEVPGEDLGCFGVETIASTRTNPEATGHR